jgi:uncharacterized membrane protein YccF (DUF307 family)
VKILLNVIWLVFSGIWLAFLYVLAAALVALTIVGIPLAKQALKLARYALWPFGRTLIQSSERSRKTSVLLNVIWFCLAGWYLALAHLIGGALQCLTIIGIPLGIANFKMAAAALVPFGREIVRTKDLTTQQRVAAVGLPDVG